MRSTRVLALMVALWPAWSAAQSCPLEPGADPRDGKPIWRFRVDNSRGYEERANADCRACSGTLDWNKGRCLRDPSAAGGASGSSSDPAVDALASVIAARASGMPVDPNTEALAFGTGAFALGAQFGDWLEQEGARGRAKAAVEKAQREAAERRRREEEARRRDESWQRLQGEVKLESGSGEMGMHFDETYGELEHKFDGSGTGLAQPTRAELAAKNRQNDFFTTLGTYRDAPVIERQAFSRGVTLARRVMYGPGDQRDTAIDEVINAMHGDPRYQNIQMDPAPVAPPVLQLVQQANVAERDAAAARLKAATAAADAERAAKLADQLVAKARQEKVEGPFMSRLLDAREDQASLKERTAVELKQCEREHAFAKDQERQSVLYVVQGPLPRPAGAAGGRPYFECAGAQTRLANWKQAYAKQEEEMRRAKALFETSKADVARIRKQGKAAVLDLVKGEVAGLAEELKPTLDQQVRAAEALGIDRATRRDLYDLVTEFQKQKDAIDQGLARARQIADLPQLKASLARLAGQWRALDKTAAGIHKALVDSGQLEKAGEFLSRTAGGPAGEKAFQLFRLNLDLYAAYGEEMIAAADRDRANWTYDAINYQHKRLEEMILTLQDGCPAVAATR